MRVRLIPLLVSMVVVAVGLARPGSAAVFGIELAGGYNTYAMEAFNDTLQSFNQSLGSSFPDIDDGVGGPFIALRVWPNDGMLLRFAIDLLDATSESPPVEFDVGPLAFTATATYFFSPGKPLRFGLGGGLGWYDIVGWIEQPGGEIDLTGGALGFHGQAELMWRFTRRMSATGVVGYRYAKIDDLKADDFSTNTEVDFSGLLFRVGLAFDWLKAE